MSDTSLKKLKTRCGHCSQSVRGTSESIQRHTCFNNYDEKMHLIVVDDTGTISIKDRTEVDGHIVIEYPHQVTEPLSQNKIDELLIAAVQRFPCLWNFKLAATDRSALIKSEAWEKVSFMLSSIMTPDESKKRWQYLRDNYTKARKKMRARLQKNPDEQIISSYRFYNIMEFLEQGINDEPTKTLYYPHRMVKLNGSYLDTQTTTDDTLLSIPSFSGQSSDEVEETVMEVAQSNSQNEIEVTDIDDQFEHVETSPTNPVDGFLALLGDTLRRLPYIKRRNLQMKLLQMAIQAEDEEMAASYEVLDEDSQF